MIAQLKAEQIDRVMSIWLSVSKSAHHFISAQYWENHYETVKNEYLPNSKTLVYIENSIICGFISIMDNEYIGALFVAEEYQDCGIGSALIEFCKERYSKLTLCAYVENERAVSFYKKHGFKIVSRSPSSDSVHEEYAMLWQKSV